MPTGSTATDRHEIPEVYREAQIEALAAPLQHLTAADCAKYAGCDFPSWSRYSHGERGIPLHRFLALLARVALRHPMVAIRMVEPIARLAGGTVEAQGLAT